MRLFQRLALDKNQLAINSATVTARSINYHAYKTWFEFDLEGRPQQNPMGPC